MELLMEDKWKLSLPPPSSKKASRSCRRPAEGSASPAPASFSTRVTSLVKEQRARFYIMRRCVTMLICWHDY